MTLAARVPLRRAHFSALLLLLLPACVLGAASTSLSKIKVDPATQHFVDEGGRIRIFHGVNAVYKLPPFHPSFDRFDPFDSLCDKDLDDLQAWGFNVVRLGVMWSAVETAPGVYNTTYLGIMRDLVQRMAARGIYTIVDAHQDVMHRSFCGEGFPDHAISAVTGPLLHFPLPLFFFDIPLDEKGTPELSACTKYPFFAFSYSFSAASAWGNFYDSDHLHQLFAGSWRAVAQAFSDPAVSGAVLAYELLNEPTSGDVWRHPLDVVNGHAVDSNYLAPIYEKVHHAVREVDEDTIIMYEPGVVGASLPFGSTGFAMGPGGRQYDDRQAFAYHIYCPSWPWGPPALLPLCKPLILGSTWDRLLRDSARIGGGRFLTEFGAVGHDADSLELLRVVLNKADTRGQSWAYWQFKDFRDITTQNAATETFYNEDGSLQTPKVMSLMRTFPQAIAGYGATLAYSFDPDTADFVLEYDVNERASPAVTEIYVPLAHYPTGIAITITPEAAATWSNDGTLVKVAHTANVADGQRIRITITRLPAEP